MDACTLEKPAERAEAEESGGKADARPSLSLTHTLYLRAGNETVSSRKKARRDETVSISSRLVTSSRETVSKKNPSQMRNKGEKLKI